MKKAFFLVMAIMIMGEYLQAQRECGNFAYLQNELQKDPGIADQLNKLETFTSQYIKERAGEAGRVTGGLEITIPVVVHILYHDPSVTISDATVASQIEILNQCFRRRNADTLTAPPEFRALAADCNINFKLAISDPGKKNTTGIIRKYTPITEWEANDDMKFSSRMGDDAWDPKSYFNIWVCNLQRIAGYSSLPGRDPTKDGIVLTFKAFGTGGINGFDKGKTAVHETGHWLNLKHIWGDEYCGDDNVKDTPPQGWYTTGCPTGTRISCANGPSGDMYMNYMDFTSDACVNLFTEGQKERMHALFAPGGPRQSILQSTGLLPPLIVEAPLPEEVPRWLNPQLFPNPARDNAILDLSYDPRWIGKNISIINMQGQVLMQVQVTSKVQSINVSLLKPGLYLLSGKKEDGETVKLRFVKI